jgi:beta-carotene 3-hydroxylase
VTRPLVLAVLAALAMEPFAALAHRAVMHGRGWVWHGSHHRDRPARLERNDLFPLVFAAATIAVMTVGSRVPGADALLWLGVGVTAYGLAYLLVHDVCIHARLGAGRRSGRYLTWVREAHRVHHLFGRAPYGFLAPVVPAALRRRAEVISRDPLRRAGRGSSPSATPATVRSFTQVGTNARREKTS